jgi:hypothetical protein
MNVYIGNLTKEEYYNDWVWDNHQREHSTRFHWDCSHCADEKRKNDEERANDPLAKENWPQPTEQEKSMTAEKLHDTPAGFPTLTRDERRRR